MHRLTLATTAFALLLGACTWGGDNGSNGNDSSSSVSSISSISSSSAVSSSSSSTDTGTGITLNEDLPAGSFDPGGDGNFEGEVYVRGYVAHSTVVEPFCETNCAEYDYVSIRVLETGSADLQGFLARNGDATTIGLGCLEDGTITYSNHSDQHGMAEFTLSDDESTAILSSNASSLVTLKLTKLPLTGGMGAPACYGHFTEIEVMR